MNLDEAKGKSVAHSMNGLGGRAGGGEMLMPCWLSQ